MMVKATKPGEATEMWYCKGALEMLLPRCSSYSVHGRPEPLTPSRVEKIKAESYEMGRRGLRVLALARGREQENLELVGMVRDGGWVLGGDAWGVSWLGGVQWGGDVRWQ